MRYRTTRRADDDVFDIYARGTRDFGEHQAERYHAGLLRAFEFIAAHPLATRERREYAPPIRMHFVGAHVVVYLVKEDHVLIIRVLHGRQDWERHLL
jgi:toxin ParE1/3/4